MSSPYSEMDEAQQRNVKKALLFGADDEADSGDEEVKITKADFFGFPPDEEGV